MEETEKSYYQKMATNIFDDALKEINKIEDRNARLDAMTGIMFQPIIACLNDLDARLRKLEAK